jgi:iron-sulfur cluster repair protein YtfE (RIC family)
MQRSEALAALSREHHHGLVVAQRLSRATPNGAAEARGEFLAFWSADGRHHFRAEEEVLLPAFAEHAPADHEAVVRVLVEHVELRVRAGRLAADPAPPLEALHELGRRLHDHIRHEERVLFPLIEEALPGPELARLPEALERAERGEG